MRAFFQPPVTRDEWAVYVVSDDIEAGTSSLLCGDGEWRQYPPYISLDYPPFSPTVRVPGRVIAGTKPVRPMFLRWDINLPGVHAAIRKAAREQECLPTWLREALA